ncbi:MAG: cyclic pyranopterin monophosphate synthase MoaC [Gammaproteobacteria bacterium]|nr:cyclic pyranopterin monophosphate synthase MoaC [Gammaproteobacteria bacterium]
MTRLTHLNARGEASMVDVSGKATTAREARAQAVVRMAKGTLAAIYADGVAKGDVLAVARVAGIQAAKRTSEFIPLCHPLALTKVGIEFAPDGDDALTIEAVCKVAGPTGVEMEALTAAAVAALTVYDMCKAHDRGMTVENLGLVAKSGGKSGAWTRAPASAGRGEP